MNLTITLGWWIIPILVAIAAYAGSFFFYKRDFDIPGFAIFIGGTGIAIGIVIGHFV